MKELIEKAINKFIIAIDKFILYLYKKTKSKYLENYLQRRIKVYSEDIFKKSKLIIKNGTTEEKEKVFKMLIELKNRL